jgi:hypothetical protein
VAVRDSINHDRVIAAHPCRGQHSGVGRTEVAVVSAPRPTLRRARDGLHRAGLG